MKLHSSLLSVGNLTKPCLSRQVFQGSMRWTGDRKVTVQGVKPSRQCSQPGSLNPGAALESGGTVKLLNTRKHRQGNEPYEADQGSNQNGKRSGSGSLTWPDANGAPPVYRVDLTRPVVDVEHGKAASYPALAGPRQAYRKASSGEAALRGSNKPTPVCNGPDMPTSIWSLFARESVESSPGGKANDD
jgi:hypothetical protein